MRAAWAAGAGWREGVVAAAAAAANCQRARGDYRIQQRPAAAQQAVAGDAQQRTDAAAADASAAHAAGRLLLTQILWKAECGLVQDIIKPVVSQSHETWKRL